MKKLLLLLIFVFSSSSLTFAKDFTVNLITDQHDIGAGDGVCDVDLISLGLQCSLRAAVEEASALDSNDRILFNLPANSTITLTSANGGEIKVESFTYGSGTLEILGTGANNLTIDGGTRNANSNSVNRIFVFSGTPVIISGVTLTGGSAIQSRSFGEGGGAVFCTGNLTVFISRETPPLKAVD